MKRVMALSLVMLLLIVPFVSSGFLAEKFTIERITGAFSLSTLFGSDSVSSLKSATTTDSPKTTLDSSRTTIDKTATDSSRTTTGIVATKEPSLPSITSTSKIATPKVVQNNLLNLDPKIGSVYNVNTNADLKVISRLGNNIKVRLTEKISDGKIVTVEGKKYKVTKGVDQDGKKYIKLDSVAEQVVPSVPSIARDTTASPRPVQEVKKEGILASLGFGRLFG